MLLSGVAAVLVALWCTAGPALALQSQPTYPQVVIHACSASPDQYVGEDGSLLVTRHGLHAVAARQYCLQHALGSGCIATVSEQVISPYALLPR